MNRNEVQELATHLEQRALWYESPGDFRAGVRAMARYCEDWLNEGAHEVAATTSHMDKIPVDRASGS